MQRKQTKLKTVNLISILFFISTAVFYLAYEKYPFARNGTGIRVSAVHDGDTVSVILHNTEKKVRLIGIDAPELAQKPWGEEAKKYLESLLTANNWEVTLEYDVEQNDQYGRILAYLWTEDGKFINLMMVRNGYAMLYTVSPNAKHAGELKAAQKEARDGRHGIWSMEGLKERPEDYRKEHPRQ
jgi:micrococcal nuclease